MPPTALIGKHSMNELQLLLQPIQYVYAIVEVVVIADGRGGVGEAGHFEELVVVVGVSRAGEALGL